MALFDFSNDIALVTGAPGGIGRGITQALLENGAEVIATGHQQSDLDELHAQSGTHQSRLHCIQSDLSDTTGWRTLAEHVEALDKRVSVFVHSASPRRFESQTALEVTEEEWDSMVNTNLRSGFFLGRSVAQRMIEQDIHGRLLFITSLHKHTPRNLPHYSASKAGQYMIVRELARALGPKGLRVNGIAPGAIPGGGFTMDDDAKEAFSQRIALGRPGTPADIAQCALTLLSNDHSAYVTGETLAVDGGLDLFNWIERPQ